MISWKNTNLFEKFLYFMPVPQQGIIATFQAQSQTQIQEKIKQGQEQETVNDQKHFTAGSTTKSGGDKSVCVLTLCKKSDYSAIHGNRAIDSNNKGPYINCSGFALFSLGKLIFLNFPLNLQ